MPHDIISLSQELTEKSIPNTLSYGETDTILYLPDDINPRIIIKEGNIPEYYEYKNEYFYFEDLLSYNEIVDLLTKINYIFKNKRSVVVLQSTIYPNLYWKYDYLTDKHILTTKEDLFDNAEIPYQCIYRNKKEMTEAFNSPEMRQDITHYTPIFTSYSIGD